MHKESDDEKVRGVEQCAHVHGRQAELFDDLDEFIVHEVARHELVDILQAIAPVDAHEETFPRPVVAIARVVVVVIGDVDGVSLHLSFLR